MRIHLLAIGKRMPGWVDDGYDNYARRLPRDWLRLHVLAQAKHGGGDAKRNIETEGQSLLGALPKSARVIALNASPKSWSTEHLRERLERWMMDGRDIALLIGGPDGLSGAVLQAAEEHWSLSALTLPHGLVRVLVAEQLYRCWSMLNNHPYHRD